MGFIKWIYKAWGNKIFIFLAILIGAFYITGKDAVLYGDTTGLYITIGLLLVYIIAFTIYYLKRKDK